MNRTRKYKTAYLVLIFTLMGIGALAITFQSTVSAIWTYLILAALFLIPGRLGGYYLNDLFKSRRLLAFGNYKETIEASERMLATLHDQPWRQWFMYCFYNIYTWSAEAQITNNMGAAYMMMGDLEQAEQKLHHSSNLDTKNPLPYYNFAIIAHIKEDLEKSKQLFKKAENLGYKKSTTDKTLNFVGKQYARYQTEL